MAATLCISNIPESTTEEDLKAYFRSKDLPLSEDHSTILFTKTEEGMRTTVSFFNRETCERALSLRRSGRKLKDHTLSFSAKFLGITVLSDGAQVDIVALHGMNGHAFDSWEHRDGDGYSFMWLRDCLPHRIPSARIMIYGYNANALSDVSEGRIRVFAETFLQRLLEKREGATSRRPIILIGHSLGGLIIKQVNSLENARGIDSRKEPCRPTLRFDSRFRKRCIVMGTPHRGLNGVGTEGFIRNFAGAFDANVDVDGEHNFVNEQRRDATVLFDLTDDFRQLIAAKRIDIATLYEIKKTKFENMSPIWIVDEQSAILGVAGERKSAIDADHKNLCKFEDSTSNSLSSTIHIVKELCKDAVPEITALDNPPSPPAELHCGVSLVPDRAESISYLAIKLGKRICIAYSLKDKAAIVVYDEKWTLEGALSKEIVSSERLRDISIGEGKISFVDKNDEKVRPVEYTLNELKSVGMTRA